MRGCSILAALALLPALSALSIARADEEALWALLKRPGHIVLLRHASAPEQPPDADVVDFNDCATQRNLDEKGRAQARRVGDAFRRRGIKSAHLVASQYCRARDTAKLTGLGAVEEMSALNIVYIGDPFGMRETGETIRRYMKSIPANRLTVLVSHVGNFLSVAGVHLSSGEMAVVHIDSGGAVAVDGRIKVP